MDMNSEKTFADKVIEFNNELDYTDILPKGIRIMNPFKSNPEVLEISARFYKRFYNDRQKRKLILGINPGRFGAGLTGVPFTDTKRLKERCGINIESVTSHEPSSVFVYDMIEAYGGPDKFYGNYYINSISPLGFIAQNSKGNWINYNYYDSQAIISTMEPFFLECLKTQIDFGIDTSVCYVLGKKNAKYVRVLNKKHNFFTEIVVLDHPRYIQQYKSASREHYISDYLNKLQ